MKKIFFFLGVFFWSMIFPNLSFNKYTTTLTSNEFTYSDLCNTELRKEIVKNAEFDFKIREIFFKK